MLSMVSWNGYCAIQVTFTLLFRTDELKWGTLVGEDKFGNKYFHNRHYFIGELVHFVFFIIIRTYLEFR